MTMSCDELCFTPATELARLIRVGQLGAREVTEAVLERIEAVEPKINSYITSLTPSWPSRINLASSVAGVKQSSSQFIVIPLFIPS